jgi:hypothetical protein
VLAQSDPAGIDFGVDVSWLPTGDTASDVRSYQVELFSGVNVSQSNSLIARVEVDATVTDYRFEAAAFPRLTDSGSISRSTVIARVTPVDGAERLTPLVSDRLTLGAASTGALSTTTAGTPTLSDATTDGFSARWSPATTDDTTDTDTGTDTDTDTDTSNPAPAGYLLRVFERLHSMSAVTANSFVVTTLDVGNSTGVVVTGLQGSSRYVASVVAYDLVDGTKRFRAASVTSTAPDWNTAYPAETTGPRTPPVEWSAKPPAPEAQSARSVTWAGPAASAQFSGGSAVTGYRIELYRSGTGLVQTTDVAATPTGPSATFRGLEPETGYSVRVAAINAQGVGEFSDYGALVRTPAGSAAGSRPPAFTDRAELDSAIAAGTVAQSGAAYTAEQGDDLELIVPWATAESGELWWYGERTFATAVRTSGAAAGTTLGTAPGSAAGAEPGTAPPTVTAKTTGLPLGDHWALFVTDGELDGIEPHAKAIAVKVTIVPSTAAALKLDDAVLRWGINDESNNGAYAGGCNYLSAGRSPDPGGSIVFTENYYSAASGNVSIQKPDASGTYVPASWATKCLDRTGAPLSSSTSTPYGGNQFVITGGAGEVDRATGSATLRWTGDVTVAYYGGMTFWYLSDPVLTVVNGTGTLTASLSGFGTDMDNQTKWQPIAERTVTLGVLQNVQIGPEGFTATPDYRAVAVALPAGQTQQSRSGADWGAFPQDFVDFHTETGQAAYWFSSGGQADAAKVAAPITIGYDAATFTAPTAAAPSAEKASARVPTVKKPPVRAVLAPVSLEATAAGAAAGTATAANSVVIVESATDSPLSTSEILLLILLLALLGLVIVVCAVGGGLVTLGLAKKIN